MSNEKITGFKLAQIANQQDPMIRHDGSFWRWQTTHWSRLEDDDETRLTGGLQIEAGQTPRSAMHRDIVYGLINLSKQVEQVGGDRRILSVANGLLDLRTGLLSEHSRDQLNTTFLPYPYDPDAPEPCTWLEFLKSVWPKDEEQGCIDTLQMWMGLNLVPETKHQKMVNLVGPKRSGKGTIAFVMRQLVGEDNVCSPSLRTIADRFALSSSIDKLSMIASEARFDGRVDKSAICDRLLQISGEDVLDIDRKFAGVWTGVLTTRITVQSNEPLPLSDDTGALLSRLIVLPMRISHAGREDTGLKDRLTAERGAILKWAIEGWRKLETIGRLDQPEAGAAAVQQQLDLLSPVSVFLMECCEQEAEATITKDDLYQAYVAWAKRNGHAPLAKTKFGTKLPDWLRETRLRDGDRRTSAWRGARLTWEAASQPRPNPDLSDKNIPF